MKPKQILGGALAGAGLGVPLLALSYLGREVAGLPLVAFDLFALVTRLLPGPVVTGGIETMVAILQTLNLGPTDVLGKFIEGALAFILMLGGLATLGALYGVFRRGWPETPGVLAGLLLWGLTLPLVAWAGWGTAGPWAGLVWTLALSLAWGAALAWTFGGRRQDGEGRPAPNRRAFLLQLGSGALALTALSLGLGRFLSPRRVRSARSESTATSLPGPSPSPTSGPPGKFEPVAGTRLELTAVEDFYRIDINLVPPQAVGSLKVDGLVDRPLTLSYTDLTAMPSSDFFATLECISNRVGGDLIGTTRFTGVSLADVLERAGLRPGVVDIKFTCADGYTESLPIESALDPGTKLCFAMEGQPLTEEHGSPVRLFTPNRFGMKNPKWIIKIEAVGEDYLGYWEGRGWSEAAWVQTTSVIDATQEVAPGTLAVGGIAYAGTRGINKVEMRLDEGDWTEAELKRPLSSLTWVLWRAQISAAPGRHRLTVRATDGHGTLQTERVARPHPTGATGHHSVLVTVG